jgi:ribosomal-protein-alanine N-acetyltransferase
MATRSLTLRRGDARDAAVVDGLMAAAFDPRYGEAWTRSQCLGVLAMPGVQLLLAFADDAPAGFSLTRAVIGEAELLLLAVDPAHRRQGIGSALLRAVLADCETSGVEKIHLEVRAGNPAVSLYEGTGFTKVGERRGYYRGLGGQAHDAHTFSRQLVASR